jgi:hypothetical protein
LDLRPPNEFLYLVIEADWRHQQKLMLKPEHDKND